MNRLQEFLDNPHIITGTATVAADPQLTLIAANKAFYTLVGETAESFRQQGNALLPWIEQSSAVRLIHKPSGIVVACQEERSQVQNREKCMQMLASKLYEIEQERINSAVTSERRSQVGTGMRNERIRTYNFPQGRVTDHRIGLTLYKIDSIMDGALDELIDALVTADQAERLQSSGEA